ncbi:MAG TPA: YtxH domain-containing protein [Gemmatimonadales bacterium]|nr:YtxH domain-containing protein [Gemmatimonadales bacterium]
MRGRQPREVVYVERGGDTSAKWLFWGALLGGGLALLYAPSSGEETRRNLQRKLWKLRAMTEEKLDELTQQLGGAKDSLGGLLEDEEEDLEGDGESRGFYGRGQGSSSPREELERRLADARARRRAPADLEEPLA